VSSGQKVFDIIATFDTLAEKDIILTLVSELNKKQGAHLANDINFDRGGTRQEANVSQKTIVIVGLSYANYLATALATHGYRVAVVELRNWRPNTMTIAEELTDLEARLTVTTNLVAIIYWCFDNATYYSITDDSVLLVVRDVIVHIHRNLIIAPSKMFTKAVKVCIPLFNIGTQAKKLVLSPLPHDYWQRRCCGDTDQLVNLE
jgi:hypothetical protein